VGGLLQTIQRLLDPSPFNPKRETLRPLGSKGSPRQNQSPVWRARRNRSHESFSSERWNHFQKIRGHRQTIPINPRGEKTYVHPLSRQARGRCQTRARWLHCLLLGDTLESSPGQCLRESCQWQGCKSEGREPKVHFREQRVVWLGLAPLPTDSTLEQRIR